MGHSQSNECADYSINEEQIELSVKNKVILDQLRYTDSSYSAPVALKSF